METADHVVSFDPGIRDVDRSDICALLQESDRVATRMHNREVYWDAWRLYYVNCLERHGCQWQATVTTQPLFISDNADLDSLELNIKGYSDPQALFDLAQRVLGSLGVRQFVANWLTGDGRGDARLLSWVIVPCELDRHGEITLTTFGVQIKGRAKTTQQTPEVLMRMSGGIYVFDPAAHAPHREGIRERLRGIALRTLAQVQL
ncbi:hypothetical protein PMM47T1_11347 [Pseudomonas sp. M47T1]|uniref:hypothetical protein n=1 Tax=Pseudomonas sp. M47T1 TaxID=1179778 RepID=UPI00026085B5|nr:hypothetical protein [Pseudomonas sp. M47T1]EIK96519.1 hypothetical protein PMM47T1_11347 [Pseudomonas sp. M47T1]